MKSSKDIPPRVGMQFACLGESHRIKAITVSHVFTDRGDFFLREGNPGGLWFCGAIEITWQPPTDDERRLLMEAARRNAVRWRSRPRFEHGGDGLPAQSHADATCQFCADAWREIAESLALDGADYDNMPDFEELGR